MLLLVSLCTSPSAAWAAGCSHLVTTRSERLRELNQLDELIFGRPSSWLRGDAGQSPADRPGSPARTPCSGPSCSNSVPLPVSTLTPVQEGRDRWGSLGVVIVIEPTSVYDRMTDEPALSPADNTTSVFHPPRV